MADSNPHQTLPFPPITTKHILNCSYHTWWPKYRTKTPKARLIPLTPAFVSYLRSDGIVLPPDQTRTNNDDDDSGYSDEDDDEDEDPSTAWPEIHQKIQDTIEELGGKVCPKLNWSAPKDATWISTTNDMECRTANEIYLLLKSSDFITHDLEQAFDGCVDKDTAPEVPYHLVLRKSFNLNPSLEFRCFVRNKRVIGITQREMNHFEFLFDLRRSFRDRILEFFEQELRDSFADGSFTFDVYLPPPHDRVWLIDVNPWAPRTDPLLFSWLELLTMDVPGEESSDGGETNGDAREEGEEDVEFVPEMRLVQKDDPEAYQFASTKYSAHKLPKDVVDASMTPGGMTEMMQEWKRVMDREEQQERAAEGST